MNNLDLRPLSIGEILDRTFTLYRNYFALFIGISAIPHILVLALNLAQTFTLKPVIFPTVVAGRTPQPPFPLAGMSTTYSGFAFLGMLVGTIALLLTEGATVIAVSELYLGRSITIGESFRRVRGELATLFSILVLKYLAIVAGLIMLVVPGVYVMCRFFVGVPSAIVEHLNARLALERSWNLTRDHAGRAFLIILLYFALSMAAAALFAIPFEIGIFVEKSNPAMVLVFMGLMQVGAAIAGILVIPVVTIAGAILYYDLRVRKEAFDLQVMMAPLEGPVTAGLPTAIT